MKKKAGRPRNEELVRGNSVQEGLTKEYTRATFIVKGKTLKRVKDYAYTERISLKDAMDLLLSCALASEEARLKLHDIELLERED